MLLVAGLEAAYGDSQVLFGMDLAVGAGAGGIEGVEVLDGVVVLVGEVDGAVDGVLRLVAPRGGAAEPIIRREAKAWRAASR